jgi:hypothetical protein
MERNANRAPDMAIAPINITSATAGNWLKEAQESLIAAENAGGLLGTLQHSKDNNGSIKSFLANSQRTAANIALISQGSLDAIRDLTLKMASDAYQKYADEKFEALAKQNAQPVNYTPPKQLDAVIYFADGTTLDTVKNIFTMPDGKQIDAKTGKEYVDESAIIRLANGAYLDTKNNILVMANGTKIDTVTGLIVSTTA